MDDFQIKLKQKMRRYISVIYSMTRSFPKYETYGITSQLQRAGVSVLLNYVEGYARRKPLIRLNFLEISYGSCQESRILLDIANEQTYIQPTNSWFIEATSLGNEIGAMLWSEINKMDTVYKKD